MHVTILADRGFGDQQLYALLRDVGFDFIVRFRGVVTVESRAGEVRAASAWVPTTGRIRHLPGARVTQARYPLDAVVCVQATGMQAPWCLAVGGATITGAQAVRLYGRRFTIEEAFRDVKDPGSFSVPALMCIVPSTGRTTVHDATRSQVHRRIPRVKSGK